jgi:hypothetical protein
VSAQGGRSRGIVAQAPSRRAPFALAIPLGIAFAIASASSLQAQTTPRGRIELGVGTVWIGETSLGGSDATETTPTGPPSRLFSTTSALGSQAGVDGRVGVRVWRRLEAEGFATYARPTLRTTIANDVEGATGVTAGDAVQQYTVGAGGLWYLSSPRKAPRLRPFVKGGGAYLRQLHAGKTLAVTGKTYEVGGGAKYFFSDRGGKRTKGYGVRGDVAVSASTGGIGFNDRTRYAPSLSASLFVRF